MGVDRRSLGMIVRTCMMLNPPPLVPWPTAESAASFLPLVGGPNGFYWGYDMLGIPELLMILAVVLVVFGAGKAADFGKSLGKGIHDFNRLKETGEKLAREPLKEVQNLSQLFETPPETTPEAPPAAESTPKAT